MLAYKAGRSALEAASNASVLAGKAQEGAEDMMVGVGLGLRILTSLFTTGL